MLRNLLLALSALLLGTAACERADGGTLFSVAFCQTGSPTPPCQSGFTAFRGGGAANGTTTQTFGNYTVADQLGSLGGYFNRGGLVNSGAFTFADLYNSFSYSNETSVFGDPAATVALTLVLSGAGISPNTTYALTLYSYDNRSGIGTHNVTITPTGGTVGANGSITYVGGVAPTTNSQYSATNYYISDGTGKLTLTVSDSYSGSSERSGVRLNAFELADVPEPGSMALAAFGVAVIALVRRRQHATRNAVP